MYVCVCACVRSRLCVCKSRQIVFIFRPRWEHQEITSGKPKDVRENIAGIIFVKLWKLLTDILYLFSEQGTRPKESEVGSQKVATNGMTIL